MPPANQDESELREAYNQAQATEDAVPSDGSSAGQPATPAAGDTQSAGFPAFFTLRLIVDISAAGAANFVMAGKAKANAPVAVPSDKLTKADAKLAEAVKQVTEQMEKEGWTPEVGGYKPSDGGAYGKEVEKRVAALMEGGEEFTFEVYVDKKTNKVLSIGEPPDGVPSRDYTQVDVVRSKVKVEVGTTLGTVNVEEVYDIKTAASGDVMSADQRHRLSAVKFGVDAPDLDARKIKVVTPPRHYSPVHGWQDHPRFGESGIKLLQFIGPATAVYLMLTADDVSAHELKDLIHGYAEVKNDPAQLTGWVLIDLKPFLERYIADGNLVKVALYAINRRLQLESQKRN
ncbi:MAG TPA: hypothetical protein VG826_05995 [Pirellulales bacterium]|nr:hypothetical protein [Pirellulales bacterium]